MSEIIKYDPAHEQLDNEIKPVSAGFYLADNGRVSTEFYQASNEVVFVNNGRRFSWTPNDMRYLDEFGMTDPIYTVQEAPLETKGNYARYNRALPDVDDWFIQENDRLKHQILIQGFQPDPSPWLSGRIDLAIGGKMKFDSDLKIVADGIEHVNPFETTGAIHLYDGDKLVFELPQVIAFDSAYDRSVTTGKYRVWFNDDAEMMFDIIVDNAWIMSLDRVYPIVIDPTVIVSGGYSLGYPNERRGVELANGWLITTSYDSTNKKIVLFKSTDRGATWSQLCYVQNGTSGLSNFAISNYGNTVHLAFSNEESLNQQTKFVKIDATTITNTNIFASSVSVFGAQKAEGFSGVSVHTEPNGTIHVAASFRVGTASYNPYNIYYTTSADGGVTWSALRNLTNYNDDIYKAYRPSVMVANGKPFVVFDYEEGGTNYGISIAYYTGSAWVHRQNGVRSSGQSGAQFASVTVDKTNIIHAVWKENNDSTGRTNILYAKSADGGATWTTAVDLTPTDGRKSMPSITVGKNGYLYVYFIGGNYDGSTGYQQLSRVIFNGTSWSAEVNLTSYTAIKDIKISTFYDPTLNSNLVGWLWSEGSAVQFDSIVLNQAPNAPVLTTKENFDATGAVTFTFTHSDPDPSDGQSAYRLQIVDSSNGQTVVDSGKVASTLGSRTVTANTLANGKQYQWRAKTWDSSDTEGAFSNYATFYTSAKPTVSITNLTEGQTYSGNSLTLDWSMSDPESEGQSAYQVRLTDAADTVLYDSGKVADSRSRARTIPYSLANNTAYKAKVTVWDGKDVRSVEAVKSFNVQYTPPATPALAVVADSTRGTLTVNITHPTPVAPQPNVQSTELFRRKADEITWTRISVNAGASYIDYTPASEVTYEYKVKANGDNGTSAESAVASGSVRVSNAQLSIAASPANYIEMVFGAQRNERRQVERNLAQFAGRKEPVTYFGEHDGLDLNVTFLLFDREQLARLRDMIDARQTLLYRDNFGRKAFVTVSELEIVDESYRHYSVSVPMTKTSYSEEV